MRRCVPLPTWSPCVASLRRGLCTAWAAFTSLILPLNAQSVDLQVRESSRTPVAGAIVRLIGENGVQSQGLTNERGRVILSAARAGKYRLKVDRIGWGGILTDPFDLAQGGLINREVLLESKPIELPALVVTGKSACNLSGAGPLTALLWEEIRKALTASVLTRRQGHLPLHVREFKRELSRSGETLREWATASSVVRGRPFGALSPAVLAEGGFVQMSGDSTTYAAPDADLLLSDTFVGTHCFRAVPVINGLVGLEFVPAPGRNVSDVKGTLWVDRMAGELKFLEYSYTGLEDELDNVGLGGRVEFKRLPTGAWIVSYWYTRMPRLTSTAVSVGGNRRPQFELIGYLDRGGRAELAAGPMGLVDRSLLVGRIFDSTASRGLAEAVVRVEGHRDSVFTDEEGRFELALPLSGDHVVVVAHPKLGLLRDRTAQAVLLSIGDSARVDLAVPSLATFVRALCGSSRGRAGIIGNVLRADGIPAADLDVRVKWLTGGGSREERDRSGPRGTFALCNLTPGPTLPVRVQDRQQVLMEERFRLEPREYRWLDLRLPPGRE